MPQLKSEDVVKSYIKRIKEVNPLINSIVDQRFEEAIQEAREIDGEFQKKRGNQDYDRIIDSYTLPGIPFTIKDCFGVKGLRLTAGLVSRKQIKAQSDSGIVKNLRKAGAIPLTSDNVPLCLMWWSAENKAWGRTNNPYDLSRIAGGSSGGSGALLSSAGAILAVGSDIGGSIRIPACMNGIFGHKTSSFTIHSDGKFPPLKEEKQRYFAIGPLVRFATDLKPCLKVFVGGDDAIRKKIPKIDDPVDFRRIKIYYMLDDRDPMKTRVSQEIKDKIVTVAEHFEEKYNSQVQEVCFEEFAKTAFMFLASMGELTETEPFAQTLAYGSGKLEISCFWELLKSFLGFQNEFTRHALVYAMIEKIIPRNPESGFLKKNLALRDKLTQQLTDLLSDDGILIMPSYPDVSGLPSMSGCNLLID